MLSLKPIMEEDYIKLIFGLKLKQLRTAKGLSLFGLSKLTGLSKSYLNEIEKGKKYPKAEKVGTIAAYLMSITGTIPEENEIIDDNYGKYFIKKMNDKRIDEITFTQNPNDE
jgi:transcriptional regulator with XRE-family HTH domain